MARVYANTLKEPDRERVEAMVMSAIHEREYPGSEAWDVFILRIPGSKKVYVSIESRDRVVHFWLFHDADVAMGDLISRHLNGTSERLTLQRLYAR